MGEREVITLMQVRERGETVDVSETNRGETIDKRVRDRIEH